MQSRPDPEILRRTAIFRALGDTAVDALLVCLRVREVTAGEVLFRQGDPGASMLIVADGVLIATVKNHSGQEQEINRMGPGETVGEMAFLDPAPRSATVRALTRTTYYELSEDGMKSLELYARPAASAVVWAIIRDVTRRLRRIDGLIEEELTRRAAGRVLGAEK
jgi:CRP/FNR family cyclic AMP-dependent transcriptional regulator